MIRKTSVSGLEYYRYPDFPAAHGFFTRNGGRSAPPYSSFNTAYKTDDPAAGLNRDILFKAVGIEKKKTTILRPNHGDRIAFTDCNGREEIAVLKDTDAAFTREKGSFFLVSSADCIILAVADKALSFAGVVHLGWRNLVNDFTGKVVDSIWERFRVDPSRVLVAVGPCIYPCCYIFENPIQKEMPFWSPFLEHKGEERYAIDLVAAVRAQLVKAGVGEENIMESGLCTGCGNDLFFSCYREGYVSGRFPTLVGLRESFPEGI